MAVSYNNLWKLLIDKRMNKSELAKAIGVTHAAISYWENNINIPNIADCIKMADFLEISLDELVGRY